MAYIPHKGDIQYKAIRIQGEITLTSPFMPCYYIGENTKEGPPTRITSSLLVTFDNLLRIQWLVFI